MELDIASLRETLSYGYYLLTFGGGMLYPERKIRNVEFHLCDDNANPLPFEIELIQIAVNENGWGRFERGIANPRLGRFFGRVNGPRLFAVVLSMKDPQPTKLRVRLSGEGDDLCEVYLAKGRTDLVQGQAAGPDWNEWTF